MSDVYKLYSYLCQMLKKRWLRRPNVPGGCVADDVVVSALPDDWEPQQCGDTLNAYLNERAERHENVLAESEIALVNIDDDVGASMRGLVDELENRIEAANWEMQKIIEQMSKKNSNGEICITLEDTCVRASEQHARLVTEVARLRRTAAEYEEERITRKRCILGECYSRLADIRHCEPDVLQEKKESRFQELNKELSFNSNTWLTIVERLRKLADEYLKEIFLKLEKITRNLVTDTRLQSDNSHKKDFVVARLDEKKRMHEEKRDKEEIFDDMQLLELWIPRLLELHKATIMKMVSDFCNDLELLNQELGSQFILKTEKDPTKNFENVRQMIEVAAGHLRTLVKRKFPKSQSQDVVIARRQGLNLEETLRVFNSALEEVYRMLHEAGHLWVDHVKRFGLAQKIILVRLENCITKNDSDELANEVGFNVELEQLRQCPDPGTLEQLNTTMAITLGRIIQKFTDHRTEELALLEELMAVPPVLGNLLLAEFECHFVKYSRVIFEETSNERFRSSHSSQKNIENIVSQSNLNCIDIETNCIDSLEEGAGNNEPVEISHQLNNAETLEEVQEFRETSNDASHTEILEVANGPMVQALSEVERQLTMLYNWRSSFLKIMEGKTTKFIENMTQQAKQWIHQRAMILHMRHSMKMLTQSVRVERICSVFELRGAELQQHENRLSSHVQAVTESVDNMIAHASCFSGPGSTIVDTLREGIEIIKHKVKSINIADPPMDSETKRLKLRSYSTQLMNLRSTFEHSFDAAMKSQREQFELRLREARVANMLFLSRIRMDSEGGRFCPAEASKLLSTLRELDDMMTCCSIRLEQGFSARRIELLSEADQNITDLLKEFKENGQRTVDNSKAKLNKKN